MIRPYRYGDIGQIKEPKEPSEFIDDQMQEYTHYAETIEDGEIMAVMGIIRMWNGVGQGFVVTSKNYSGGIRYTRAVIAFVNRGMKELNLHRLQTYIDVRWMESARFAELVGLYSECLLRKMSPDGADLFLYARIEE